MFLCENLVATASLQELARETALLLGTPDCVDGIARLRTTQFNASEPNQPEVFSEWISQFDSLAEEVAKSTSTETKEKLALAGLKARKPRPKEPGTLPAILLTNQAVFTSTTDRPFSLLPLPVSDDTHQKIIHHIRTRDPHLKEVDLGTPTEAKFRLQSDISREVRSEAAFRSDSVSLVFECVRVRTMPSLLPFLMLPIPTERQQDE